MIILHPSGIYVAIVINEKNVNYSKVITKTQTNR